MDDAESRPPEKPIGLTDETDLDAFVDAHPLALVEFYTEGCSICASMDPILSAITRTTDAAVGTINPRDDPPLIDRFDVRSVPLLVIFVDGDPVARRAEGFVGVDDLQAWLAEAMDGRETTDG